MLFTHFLQITRDSGGFSLDPILEYQEGLLPSEPLGNFAWHRSGNGFTTTEVKGDQHEFITRPVSWGPFRGANWMSMAPDQRLQIFR